MFFGSDCTQIREFSWSGVKRDTSLSPKKIKINETVDQKRNPGGAPARLSRPFPMGLDKLLKKNERKDILRPHSDIIGPDSFIKSRWTLSSDGFDKAIKGASVARANAA